VGPVVRVKILPRTLAALLILGACSSPGPAVDERTYAPPGAALARVAVIPFTVHRTYEPSRLLGGVPPEEASERVTRLVARALAQRGIAVVDPDEVAFATTAVPRTTNAIDALLFAEVAGRELSATGVLLGEVLRFRESRGASPTARRPASVSYQVTLYEAPEGGKLWTARFDETQAVTRADPATASSGAEVHGRWLSAGEIAQRGADAVAKSLAESL
jgi:hypothetical protein